MTLPGFLLNIDKPVGPTSRDAVDAVVRLTGAKRTGHAGTLDPLASGVLIVAVGNATRLIEYVQQLPKTYEAEFHLGRTSDTDDCEGAMTVVAVAAPPTREELDSALESFRGEISQVPPRYSAVKVGGRRAHKLARKGVDVRLEPRKVTVHSIDRLAYEFPFVRLRIGCSGGTYIRSIARDLGAMLGVGGLMSRLRRTAIGCFDVDSAVALDALSAANWSDHIRPMTDAVAHLPALVLDDERRRRFLLGQPIPFDSESVPHDAELTLFDRSNQFLGIGRLDRHQRRLRTIKGGFA